MTRSLTGAFLEGYPSEVSVTAGESLDVHLSFHGGEEAHASANVVRLPDGRPEAWGSARDLTIHPRLLDTGSFVRVPAGIDPGGSFTLAVWLMPTALTRGWQAVAGAWLGSRPAFGLFLGGSGLLAGYVRTQAGERWCSGFFDLTPGEWWHLALAHDAERGRLEVHQRRKGEATSAVAARELAAAPVARSDAFMLAAAPPEAPGGPHRAHLNGKLARPVVVGAALDADGSAALGTEPGEGVVAAWDLGALPHCQTAPELSGNAPDGVVVGAPARGVTGPGFAGQPGTLRRDRPEWYDAIYFHDDDLDDAGWPATMSVEVPADAPSGIYAVVVSGEREELPMPFVVRPRTPRERVAFLVPTLTWQAYNSNIAALSYTEDGVLDARPCLYDTHTDGSIVYHTTRRQPTRSTHPRLKPRDWGAHVVAADLDLTAWLDRVGVGWDALGDEQLDALGGEALEGYDCLVLGAHPEYFTRRMQDAVRAFVADGGRMLYLGGNGMFWVTSIDPERRHLLEVRKVHALNHPLGLEAPGEVQHCFDDEIGGLWEAQDLPPRTLLGVDTATMAFGRHDDNPAGFHRTDAAADPAYAWIFDGVDEEPIGAYGSNMGSAAGCEMDTVGGWIWPDGEGPVLLARASHPDFDLLDFPPRTGPAVADVALMLHPGGGAVFSAGSITWGGSLAHNDYDNGVARLSENVLRRFLDTPRGKPVTA